MECPQCGKEHALLEPTFKRPDAVAGLPTAERQRRVLENDDVCNVEPGGGDEVRRHFLRTVLPVSLLDVGGHTQWGLWVEVTERDLRRVLDLWDSLDQASEPPFEARVANQVTGYPNTIGLPVQVQLTGPTTRPALVFDASVAHPFAAECRAGVTSHRVMEWLAEIT